MVQVPMPKYIPTIRVQEALCPITEDYSNNKNTVHKFIGRHTHHTYANYDENRLTNPAHSSVVPSETVSQPFSEKAFYKNKLSYDKQLFEYRNQQPCQSRYFVSCTRGF
jgi:hypothetical protein